MLARIVNPHGVISYNKTILDQIIDRAFDAMEGRMWLANYKGAVSDVLMKLGSFDVIAEKKVELIDGSLYIHLFVVVKLGESITDCCDAVMKAIAEDIHTQLELPLDNIEVTVTGSLSKNKNIARRDLTLSYREMLNGVRKDYGYVNDDRA